MTERYITIGIEKYDDDFKIPYDENMTLEQFHISLEKAIGPCKLNITKYEEKKTKKMKDFVNGNTNIYLINNDNLGTILKY